MSAKRRSSSRTPTPSRPPEAEPLAEEAEAAAGPKTLASMLRGENVAITGATEEDEICGIVGSGAEGVVLDVRSGVVRSWHQLLQQPESRDAALDIMARFLGVAREAALERMGELAGRAGEPNHEPAGKGCECDFRQLCHCKPTCRFVIAQPGALTEYAAEAGTSAELERLVQEGAECTWADVLALTGRHTLCLRRVNFRARRKPPVARAGWEGLVFSIAEGAARHRTITKAEESASAAYVLQDDAGGSLAVQVPRAAAFSRSPEEAARIVAEATGAGEVEAKACLATLRRLTPGQLKSALQKAVRFGAGEVQLDAATRVRADVFAAAAEAALFCHAGSFVPDLQLFSRGCTSAFKRLGVILFEDAWVADEEALALGLRPASLFALALLSARVPSWQPSAGLVRWAVRLAGACNRSRCALDITPDERPAANPGGLAQLAAFSEGLPEPRRNGPALRAAAVLLRMARSFPGDERLAANAAADASAGRLNLLAALDSRFPAVMPLFHIVDQHAFRGVAHLASPAAGATFAEKFRGLFATVTGVNPRRGADASQFEGSAPALSWRPAQALCYALTFEPRQQLPVVEASPRQGPATATQHVGMGALAGAVGSVAVKVGRRRFFCTLGELDPEEEVVMLAPSRTTTELYLAVTPEERAEVVRQVRGGRHPLSRELSLGAQAWFDAARACWVVDGEPWRERRRRLEEDPGEVAWHPAADPRRGPGWQAATFEGTGVRIGGLEAVAEACRAAPARVLLRALALTRQQHRQVRMPQPSLQGGKGADEAAVRECDPEVCRLLLLVACRVPGALRAREPPHFDVPSSSLLRQVEGIIAAELDARRGPEDRRSEDRRSAAEPWPAGSFLAPEAADAPKPHQAAAVEDMLERDEEVNPHAHFIFMATGSGKTLTAVTYLRRLDAAGGLPPFVIWAVPGPTKADMLKTLARCGARAAELVMAKTGHGRVWEARPAAHRFNVVSHDDLRLVVDSLVEAADRSVVVVDEVDRCYASTLRTSAAFELATLARKVICMTATPMRNNSAEGLAGWLAMCVDFPLTERNWWVAANSMVSKQFDLGIELRERLIRAPFDPAIRAGYAKAVEGRRWLDAARLVWDALDRQLAGIAAEAARSRGGCLLVARDGGHAARLAGLVAESRVFDGVSEPPSEAAVVIVTKVQSRGYNWAIRLGALVTGVYPGNAADRKQMVGRVMRIGQRRPEVEVVAVVMAGTIVELLHERHTAADRTNTSLEQLGEHFSARLLEAIGPGSDSVRVINTE